MKRNIILSIILCITLLFSTSAVAFANSGLNTSCDKTTEIISFELEYDQSDDIIMDKNIEGDDVSVTLHNGNIITISSECYKDYSIKLPDTVNELIGFNKNGTAVFDSKDGCISIAAKVTLENYADLQGKTIEFATTYNNSDFSDQKFKIDLPDNYKIVSGTEYSKLIGENKEVFNDLYVLDEHNDVINVIEAPKAFDSNGDAISVYFKTEGDTIIQTINCDDSVSLPVMVVFSSHPNITKTAYLTKTKVAAVISQIDSDIADASNFTGTPLYWIINATNSIFGAYGIAADAITTWLIKPTHIKRLQARKSLYNSKYVSMSSNNSLKVVTVLRWQHHGSNDGTYVIRSESLTII